MDFLINHWEVGLAALLALATIITRATKSPKDDQALASVKRVLGRTLRARILPSLFIRTALV